MCGISGIFECSERGSELLLRDLATMHAAIPHRGPDGEGFALFDAALQPHRLKAAGADEMAARGAFAFRWLHVQDPSPAAAQPMSSRDGRKWLVFNGEIYNELELRDELGRAGVTFRSRSDAEVILAAYEMWGTACFARFIGMWSLLLADLDRRALIGSRDRFGIRPFFYARLSDRIVFASEIKQIVPLLSRRRINDHYLHTFLRQGTVNHYDQETFFADVHTVPPATHFTLEFDHPRREIDFVRYWDVPQAGPLPDTEESLRELERRLCQSVAFTLRTPATTASFLSGGLDSSLLTALMREVEPRSRNFETYSLVFDRKRYAAFDESPYIDDFVARHGVRNLSTTFDAAWMRDHIADVTRTQEEPLVASALMAQWRLCQLAGERGARVVLDGQGADEIFAGYPHHEWMAWHDRLSAFDVSAFREAGILASKYHLSVSRLLLQKLLAPAAKAVIDRFGFERRRYPFIDDSYFKTCDAYQRSRRVDRAIARSDTGATSSLGRLVVHDVRSFGLRPILLHGDRAGMAHSIETRVPYLDHRVVEMALMLPPGLKVGFGERKRALRSIAKSRLPDSILARTDKMGFVTPEPLWLRGELREDMRATGTDARLAALRQINAGAVSDFISGFLSGQHDDSRAVWRLWALARWAEVFDMA